MTTMTPRVHDHDGSRLVAYDLGASLAGWSVDGEPVVWFSDQAVLDGSAPLRGGIPICFPWFAAGPRGEHSPSHGLVRTATWRRAQPTQDEVWAWVLSSEDVADAPGAEHLTGPFRLRYGVSLCRGGGEAGASPALHVALTITNPGDTPLQVEAALHTYLAVHDVRTTQVLGLDGTGFFDKVDGVRRVQQGPVTFTGETDRVYDASGEAGLVVADDRRELLLRPEGATQAVVWNPWAQKCADLADLADDAWLGFVCVESAATADRALVVPPGDHAVLGFTLSVRPPTAS